MSLHLLICKFVRDRLSSKQLGLNRPSSCNEHESGNFLSAARRSRGTIRSISSSLPSYLSPSLWQKTRYPKRRVLIFSRLPRLDLAGDSTPANTVSTFPNSRVVGGRNVDIGKGNVRPRVYTSTLCIHKPHSRVPLLARFLLSGTKVSFASQMYIHSRYCPPCVHACARMPTLGNASRPSRYLCVCEVLIN